ncbi:DUF2252 domain-containing protein [Gordonia rhizosphera]|uniref:DUF2252 domain-containing protein n=1 Tax=Gordonia rhizosphera NBRC 16068 TaxID=1108045 RepID=K6VBJ5_9ACTN|nr:DUF2252 domain-containing protein [Gordonia rhizosphera]GAB93593.1 hypothetical protein GORHZ_233_00040 [Gordonia rhizosphera NBRC 16068]
MAAATMTDLAQCVDPGKRRDPLDILADQAKSRVPELVPVRHARMAATPFTFYRGAAAVMAADLAATPNSGVQTQICGDAHLSNFGVFYTPERRMVFDVNDFDETSAGPFEWDVKRLAASLVVASRGNGFDAESSRKNAREAARSYQKWMQKSVTQSTMDCWYEGVAVEEMLGIIGSKLDSSTEQRAVKGLQKASHRNSIREVSKLCVFDEQGNPHIRSEPPLLVPISELASDDLADEIQGMVAERISKYRAMLPDYIKALFDQFTLVDVARKVVGVGSVGTRCWIVLLQGKGADDRLFLQLKEAQRSVLADHIPATEYPNEGQRVVEGQRLLQAASDVFLGWTTGYDENGERRDLYVRQLKDGKGSVVIEILNPKEMRLYARLCGQTLAQAHARTASRFEIADFLGTGKEFENAIADFSMAYADLNDTDHTNMLAAIDAGRIEVHDLG